MQADFSVELGAEDDCLEVPWQAERGEPRYYDLKRRPELLLNVREAFDNRELGEFLAAANSAASILETSKCDTWTSNQLSEEELIYGARCKFCSYIDMIFGHPRELASHSGWEAPHFSFERHQQLARSVCELLRRAPEISAAAEFIVRRCYYGATAQNPDVSTEISCPGEAAGKPPRAQDRMDAKAGFGFTFYLSGYGDDPGEARKRWNIGLKLVENALLQISAAQRPRSQ